MLTDRDLRFKVHSIILINVESEVALKYSQKPACFQDLQTTSVSLEWLEERIMHKEATRRQNEGWQEWGESETAGTLDQHKA